MSCSAGWSSSHPDSHMDRLCADCQEPGGTRGLCTLCNKHLCCRCAGLHQHTSRATPMLPLEMVGTPTPVGSSCWTGRAPPCHLHGQQPLELFCETCDLLACSQCHLSRHADHRLVHVGKALREQVWLFESLAAQLEDKRSSVENLAKQVESRIHGVKTLQRKAENQIKMTKMIIINELNKRVNLLLEQLKKLSGNVRQQLEGQLQGMVELCSQLGHMQNFLGWATSHHQRGQLLFTKELVTYQIQQLLESQLHRDVAPPVKIKFNWDASFWTKQISTLGHLTAEGGCLPHSERGACPNILKPHPIPCPTLPASLCHRAVEQACGFQACVQPQACCLSCVGPKDSDPHPDLLMDLSMGSSSQRVGCHQAGPCPDAALLPRLGQRRSEQLSEKCLEAGHCLAGCAQPSPAPPAVHCPQLQGLWQPERPQALVTHMKQPQQQARQRASPREDAHSGGPSGRPLEPAPAECSSLQLLLQAPHRACMEQRPPRAQGWVDLDKLQLALRRSGVGPGCLQPARRCVGAGSTGPRAQPGAGASGPDPGGLETMEPKQQQQTAAPPALGCGAELQAGQLSVSQCARAEPPALSHMCQRLQTSPPRHELGPHFKGFSRLGGLPSATGLSPTLTTAVRQVGH